MNSKRDKQTGPVGRRLNLPGEEKEMAKYMVIINTDDGPEAFFTDDLNKAEETRMNSECGMGWYAEVYERIEDEEGDRYELMYC